LKTREKARFGMKGKGCAGSMARGVRMGNSRVRKASSRASWSSRERLAFDQAVLAEGSDALPHLGLQSGDAHHVELVEVIGRDRQKAQALEQGVSGIAAFGQDPAVEGQPGQLPVEEPLRRTHQVHAQ